MKHGVELRGDVNEGDPVDSAGISRGWKQVSRDFRWDVM